MDIYKIRGGKKLSGSVNISGSKNAALPIIVASLLADGETTLKNVPNLQDIRTMIKAIEYLGAKTSFDPAANILKIKIDSIKNNELPYELVKTMRASIYVMGPLLARIGEADVSMPGGCAIGERPVDIHLSGFEAMGASVELEHGFIKARVKQLQGADYTMRQVSVGATANLMMAAVLGDGKTVLEKCAMEPDITDLGSFLSKMGAKIKGLGTERIEIEGVKKLKPVEYDIMPDRIEAGTYLIAAAITRGGITINGCVTAHIEPLLSVLSEMGFIIESGDNHVKISAGKKTGGAIIKTNPHPGFPTDLQAPIMSLAATLPGISTVTETIFENRFTHVPELRRMGADITIEGNVAIIRGVKRLSAAPVMMSDLRAGAALVTAALAAKGETEIRRIYHSDRGYEKMPEKLGSLGASIRRLKGKG
ncbi:MAG: UDP-N-acetylglucosamine 1-carboxyvinyltransferase [Leptospirales bacterium]|nr:UDP-N-acetylglucosamine 1-carboxyvinyltransferase [Leptospirales bacterium]